MDTLQHHLQLYQVAAERLTQYLHTLPANAWHHPSTCEAWEVRDVVGHLVWGAELHMSVISRGVQGDVSPPEGSPLAGAGRDAWAAVTAQSAIAYRERLGEQLLATFEARIAQLHQLLASLSPQDWEKPCAHPVGLRPARLFAPLWVVALAMHGWDIRSPLDPTAHLLAESFPLFLEQIAGLGSFRPGAKLPTPIRYRFALTGADPSVRDILVEGETARMEPAGAVEAAVTFRCDTETFILLMYGRFSQETATASGRLVGEGDPRLIAAFDQWFKGI
jgi:uncharacterized protein (TIGR03083 family)